MFIPRLKQKIFCIGHNKTGTTSLQATLTSLGYKLGLQHDAELMLEDWGSRNFKPIIRYCKSADAFQDVPFSLEYTYIALDQAFPGSKFILTIRDNADQWFESLSRFHAKLFGTDGTTPTAEQLREAKYCRPGWIWRYHQLVWNATDSTAYDKANYIAQYNRHNAQVCDYFKTQQNNLLVLNLANPDANATLGDFLGVSHQKIVIPHLNRSDAGE